MIEDRLNEIRTGLRDGERKIYQLRETIERKERQMVKESDEGKRKRLLSEIKEHNREIFWIKQDMTDSQFDLHFQELEYGRKLRLYSQ
jgi:predicted  nucleic acid-binding Zn-ribbon protein